MSRSEIQHAQYEKMKSEGAYCGSVRDASWDRNVRMHTCCESKKAIYHRAGCPTRSGDLSDLKDPTPIEASAEDLKRQITALRIENEQITSIDVARKLGVRLRDVNKQWPGTLPRI